MRRFYIRTYGCQMNVKDSERMAALLEDAGYVESDAPEEADVLLVNTCSVRQKPEDKALGLLGSWEKIKRCRPNVVVGMAGCFAQKEGAEMLERFPGLDLVVGTHMIHCLPQLVERAKSGERIAALDWLSAGRELFHAPLRRPSRVTAFVTIMQGCNNNCAYCIVPRVRGPAVNREVDEILAEGEALAAAGVREVTLLGQNVNVYHHRGVDFPALLALVAQTPGLERVRFTTSHPRDVDEKMIRLMAENRRIMEHLHLPVQAGSDRVLARMNRGYSRTHYLALVRRLRETIPESGLTTDLIVGFPGEREEDFAETLSLVEEVRYDETFSFRFSPRPGTPAAQMRGGVPEEEKYRRLYQLQELQRAITEEKNKEQVGRVHEVLVEGRSKTDPAMGTGRSRTNRLVHFPLDSVRPGAIVKVRITEALKHSLRGEMLEKRKEPEEEFQAQRREHVY